MMFIAFVYLLFVHQALSLKKSDFDPTNPKSVLRTGLDQFNDHSFPTLEEQLKDVSLPPLRMYIERLHSQYSTKYQTLPRFWKFVLSDYYSLDFNSVSYAERVDTVHRDGVTIGNTIYFPKEMDFEDFTDDELEDLLSELYFAGLYKERGAGSLLRGAGLGNQGSLNLHHSPEEREAREYTRSVFGEIRKRLKSSPLQKLHDGCDDALKIRSPDCASSVHRYCLSRSLDAGIPQEVLYDVASIACFKSSWYGDVSKEDLKATGVEYDQANTQSPGSVSAAAKWCKGRGGAGLVQEVVGQTGATVACFLPSWIGEVTEEVMRRKAGGCQATEPQSASCMAAAHRWCEGTGKGGAGIPQGADRETFIVACFEAGWYGDVPVIADEKHEL
jgi:hypothetical protein